jgi:hypothetical protein
MGRAPKTEVEKIDVKRAPINLNVSCGTCRFLNRAGVYENSKGGVTCASFGTVSSSTPCRWYSPEPSKVCSQKGLSLGELLYQLTDCSNPQALAAALMSRAGVKRLGFALGDQVYFHVLGGDYICNYASGRIIGCVHKLLIIEGDNCSALYKPDNVLNLEGWHEKLGRLLKANKVNDPDGGLRKFGRNREAKLMHYIPPHLSKVAVQVPKKRGRKKKSTVIALS